MTLREQIDIFKKYGITPARIAREAGIDRTSLGKWVNGSRPDMTDETRDKVEAAMRDIAHELNEALDAHSNPVGVAYDDDF